MDKELTLRRTEMWEEPTLSTRMRHSLVYTVEQHCYSVRPLAKKVQKLFTCCLFSCLFACCGCLCLGVCAQQHVIHALGFVLTVESVPLSGLLSSLFLEMDVDASELVQAMMEAGMENKHCHVTVWDSDSFCQSAQGLLGS